MVKLRLVDAVSVLFALAFFVAPHSCQSGSTNFLQLFLEANNGTSVEISKECSRHLDIIMKAVHDHSFWAAKCTCVLLVTNSRQSLYLISNCIPSNGCFRKD